MKDISVLIPTHAHDGRNDDLRLLTKSLLTKDNHERIKEILIVDNGCSLSEDFFSEHSPLVKIVKEPKIGLNNARNCGIKHASGHIVAFLDDDIIAAQGWAEGISKGHQVENVLCVGGPVMLKEGKNLPFWMSDYFTRFLFPPSFPEESGYLREPYYLIGANMSFKKSTFETFSLFNTQLDRKGGSLLSNGDTDFIIRIPRESVWYSKEARVTGAIKTERLTRLFMVRRLFWQGISDYLMVKSNGIANFYDRNEIFMGMSLARLFVGKLLKLKFFECFCMCVRIAGYYFGVLYKKREGQNATFAPLE